MRCAQTAAFARVAAGRLGAGGRIRAAPSGTPVARGPTAGLANRRLKNPGALARPEHFGEAGPTGRRPSAVRSPGSDASPLKARRLSRRDIIFRAADTAQPGLSRASARAASPSACIARRRSLTPRPRRGFQMTAVAERTRVFDANGGTTPHAGLAPGGRPTCDPSVMMRSERGCVEGPSDQARRRTWSRTGSAGPPRPAISCAWGEVKHRALGLLRTGAV